MKHIVEQDSATDLSLTHTQWGTERLKHTYVYTATYLECKYHCQQHNW